MLKHLQKVVYFRTHIRVQTKHVRAFNAAFSISVPNIFEILKKK